AVDEEGEGDVEPAHVDPVEAEPGLVRQVRGGLGGQAVLRAEGFEALGGPGQVQRRPHQAREGQEHGRAGQDPRPALLAVPPDARLEEREDHEPGQGQEEGHEGQDVDAERPLHELRQQRRHAYHFRRLKASRARVSLLRWAAMMIASPTAASAAATVRTKKTRTWPSIVPRARLKATKARFTALSMSSTHMNTVMTLRRRNTPTAPTVKRPTLRRSAGAARSAPLIGRPWPGPPPRRAPPG